MSTLRELSPRSVRFVPFFCLFITFQLRPLPGACQDNGRYYHQKIAEIRSILRSNPDSALHLISSMERLDTIPSVVRAEFLKLRGSVYILTGKMDSANVAFSASNEIIDEIISGFREASDTMNLEYFEATKTRANNLNNLAIVAYYRFRYEHAVNLYIMAAETHQFLIQSPFDVISKRAVKDFAGTIDNIANIFNALGQSEKALEYRMRALHELGPLNDITTLGVMVNIANYYESVNQGDSVRKYTSAIIQIASDSLPVEKSIAFSILGGRFAVENEIDSAHKYLRLATPILEKAGSNRWIASHYRNLGKYYTATAKYSDAIEYLLRSAELEKSMHIGNNLVYTWQLLYNAYYEKAMRSNDKNDFINAIKYLRESNALYDTLVREQKFRDFNELQTKYETEKKESENQRLIHANMQQSRLNWMLASGGTLLLALLMFLAYFYQGKQKANIKLELQKRQIQSSLLEKEALLREIHHRVKNNLQIISSLLNMQSYHIEDPRLINVIADGQHRVKAMALIHQKLYQTDHLSEIDFREYTEQLILHLAAAFGAGKKIQSTVNGSSLKVDIDTAIPLGLILNELITNAYKYAFNDIAEGKIIIDLKLDETHHYHLRVADSGKGLPEGFSATKLNSLGLKLVHMLTEQLNGSLTISNDPGANFYIRFKKITMTA